MTEGAKRPVERRGLEARAAEHVRGGARLAGRPDHEPCLVHHVRERLVGDHVLAGAQARERDRGVEVVGRHAVDRVQVLLLREQLAKVGVGPAARARCGPVVAVHELAADLAPAGAGSRPGGPIRVAQEAADLVAQLEARPLDVVLAAAVRIAHGDDAELRQETNRQRSTRRMESDMAASVSAKRPPAAVLRRRIR